MTYNPEVGLPITGEGDWEHPELLDRVWTAGEIQAALTRAGFKAYDVDETSEEECSCVAAAALQPLDSAPSATPEEWVARLAALSEASDCAICNNTRVVPMRLFRSRRWVRGDQALRVPLNPDQIVSPYLAACVVALLA